MFPKLDLFPSSGEREGKTPTLLGPLERVNLNHWTSETMCFLVSRIPDVGQSKKQ
jgi:hypothetical protein